jgi:hypothetical protein
MHTPPFSSQSAGHTPAVVVSPVLLDVASLVAVVGSTVPSLADSDIPPSVAVVVGVTAVVSVPVPVASLAPVVGALDIDAASVSTRPSSPQPLSAPHSAVVQPKPRKLFVMCAGYKRCRDASKPACVCDSLRIGRAACAAR